MNRSRMTFLGISLAILLPLATGVLWSSVSSTSANGAGDSIYKYLSIFSEVFNLVHTSYVDQTDSAQLLDGAIDGADDALDPFSSVIRAGEMPDYQRSQTLAIAHSGIVVGREHGVPFVLNVEKGSPAEAAGFQRGDVLAELDGAETRVLPLWKLDRRLAGNPGDKLAFRIVRDGETIDKTLVLGEFTPAPPRLEDASGFPMLRLNRLPEGATASVRPLLADLATKQAPKLLVDLRGDADGSIDEAYRLGALFVQGKLGELDQRGTAVKEFHGDAPPAWKGEVVVLVDSGTLGAAEVLAAILHQGAGAQLVGVPTFGWAGQRTFFDLSDGAKLHLTTAFYTGPDGKPISSSLTPEVLVDDLSRSYGEADRPLEELILDRGIQVLSGQESESRRAA
jgi:carboxyl-terminal processing protease